MKKILIIAGVVLVAGVILFVSRHRPTDSQYPLGKDGKNATYQVDGQRVTLKDGTAHIVAGDDSAPQATIKYFGNDVTADLNGDGLIDEAFVLTQDNGGSGTFYYVVAALKTASGYQGTNGIFLGDRIAPQTTEFHNGQIVVNYADRKPGEPFTTKPSVGVSRYFTVNGNNLIEIK